MSAMPEAMALTVCETVAQHYEMPFTGRKYQVGIIDELGLLQRSGLYLDQGTGKTYCSTMIALYKMLHGADVTVCIMPPILTVGWRRWLERIKPKGRDKLDIVMYRGTPKERDKIQLRGDFILMSMQIFKNDHDRIMKELAGKRVVVLVDEATSIKNVSSQNYKKTSVFAAGQDFMALTGTPLTTPIDGYAMCKFVAPSLYRNLHQFENIHVAERDFFKKVTSWKNLPLLAENMKVNSARVLRQEALKDLPPVIYDPMYYELDPAHYALYAELAEEQLLPLQNGGKIDATSEQRLFNALQQIVVNYDYFADDPRCVSKAIDLVEEVVEQLAGKKLLLFANYKMTNRKLEVLLGKRFGALAVYGDIPGAQQRRNIDKFIESQACQILIAQPQSAGYGVDGLQDVCSDVLFLEMPSIPRDFHQAVARIWRDGLKSTCQVRIAVAEGTMQERRLQTLLSKDSLIGQVQRNYEDLRDAIFGGRSKGVARRK